MVCGLDDGGDYETDPELSHVRVKIMFTNPTHQEMLPCSYYLNGHCQFTDEQCRYEENITTTKKNRNNLIKKSSPDFHTVNYVNSVSYAIIKRPILSNCNAPTIRYWCEAMIVSGIQHALFAAILTIRNVPSKWIKPVNKSMLISTK